MSLIDISPYKFRKLAGQKDWVHVVCRSMHKNSDGDVNVCLSEKMRFVFSRRLYQTPTEGCTERITPTQAKPMQIRSKT